MRVELVTDRTQIESDPYSRTPGSPEHEKAIQSTMLAVAPTDSRFDRRRHMWGRPMWDRLRGGWAARRAKRGRERTRPRYIAYLTAGVIILAVLAVISVLIGNAHMSILDVFAGRADAGQMQVLTQSRIPRTLALMLSGAAMAVAGLVMQLLVRNRFVEPSTTGVTESAGLGVLVATIFMPTLALGWKMVVAVVFALIGTFILNALIRAIPSRDIIIVPLLGLILSGVIGAAATFLAWEFQLQGTLNAWMTGDFSGIVAGRYELLWIVAVVTVFTYVFADRFTVAGLGEDLAKNLGMNHGRIVAIGLAMVAIVTGITTVVAGPLPFLGLVVPNLVSLIQGDYIRRSLPLVAIGGAIFVTLADAIGRTLIAPAEIPVGVIMGIIGAAVFLTFLLRRTR